jgi:hypothetical protein
MKKFISVSFVETKSREKNLPDRQEKQRRCPHCLQLMLIDDVLQCKVYQQYEHFICPLHSLLYHIMHEQMFVIDIRKR